MAMFASRRKNALRIFMPNGGVYNFDVPQTVIGNGSL
jgi:hypothetical protein